jgi:Putative mono-oxygenase ydhR
MSTKILQVNFKFNISRAAYEEVVLPMASQFAEVPGCRWKIWLINEAKSEAGGIYLFEDEHSLKAFLKSPLVSAIKNYPAFSDFNVKYFDTLDAITKITRGPIEKHFRLEDLPKLIKSKGF